MPLRSPLLGRRAASLVLLGSALVSSCAVSSVNPPKKPALAGAAGPDAPVEAISDAGVAPAQEAHASHKRKRPRPITAGFDCASVSKAPTTCSLVSPQGRYSSPFDDVDPSADDPHDTLNDLMTFIACSPEPSPNTAKAKPSPRWDHKSAPERLDLVDRRFGVTKEERDHLFKDGLVVSSRLEYPDYGRALQDVHRSQLPLYFSVDALFHAIYIGHDRFLAELETTNLSPTLHEMLAVMHGRLAANRSRYWSDTLDDLDIYLTVARRLLATDESDKVDPIANNEKEVDRLIGIVNRAGGIESVRLFGRDRMIDTSQFRPRGHYASAAAGKNPYGADLSHYFRAAMWLSRIEFNLVSRSSQSSSPVNDPSETPREATAAMALAELARDVGEIDHLKAIDRAWAILAGKREDVSSMDLLDLMNKASISDALANDAPEKLRAAIGTGFVRTARTHFQAPGSAELPVIATLLGPRITNDTQATRPVVHPAVYERREVPAVEMAYLLGHDRAASYLAPALAAFPHLKSQMDLARGVTFGTKTIDGKLQAPPATTDLYSSWLDAIRGLSETPIGTRPTFTETDAWADMRVSSAVAAYGQIRHNYVLIVPTTYDESGCEIPDAYLEPAPAVYAALIEYAKRGQQAVAAFEKEAGYFDRLENVLRVLERIGDRELLGEPLLDEEKRFLAQVVEDTQYRANGYGPSTPVYNGWYYDLFRAPEEAHESATLVADYFASVDRGMVDYAGVASVRMGFFVVDTNGKPRVAVGPVARSFQARGPLAPRYSDDEVGKMNIQDPWASSYTAKRVTTTPFTIRPAKAHPDDPDQNMDPETYLFDVTTTGDAGKITLALLDHHHVPVASETHEVRGAPGRPAKVRFAIKKPALTEAQRAFGIEGLHVSAGSDFHWVADEHAINYLLGDTTARFEIGPTTGKRIGGYDYTYSKVTRGSRGRY